MKINRICNISAGTGTSRDKPPLEVRSEDELRMEPVPGLLQMCHLTESSVITVEGNVQEQRALCEKVFLNSLFFSSGIL